MIDEPADPVPAEILAERGLPSLGEALRGIHRPASDADHRRARGGWSGTRHSLCSWHWRSAGWRAEPAGAGLPAGARWAARRVRRAAAVHPDDGQREVAR